MIPNRRQFLAAGAAAALSQSRIIGANDRVLVGGIGTGGRCRYLLRTVNKVGGAQITAVCDVYAPNRRQAIEEAAPGAEEFGDYRRLLDRKDLDAVVIGSPDHWHVQMASDALAAGKDVYLEKPVTHTIEEGAQLLKAVHDSNRVLQCGMQQRSWEHFATAADMIRNGQLGQITQVRTYWFQNYQRAANPAREVDVSALDWKAWLGKAPEQPFDSDRFRIWRWYWDFGGGALTDLFTHWVDVVHWAMASDVPQTASALGSKRFFPQRDCPDTINAAFDYPGFMVSYDGTMVSSIDDGGLEFRGSKGTIKIDRSRLLFYEEGPRGEDPKTTIRSTEDGTIAHMRNFFDCVRSRKQPNAPVETGIAAARAGHLGNRALRSHTVLTDVTA